MPRAEGCSSTSAARPRFFQAGDDLLLGQLHHALQRLEAELAADHRGHGQHLVGPRAQPRQPLADHVAQALGDAACQGLLPDPAQRPSRLSDETLLDQVAQHLLDEQRVALGLAVDQLAEAPGDLLPG